MDQSATFLEFVIEILRHEPNASLDGLERLWTDSYGELPSLRERRSAFESASRQLTAERADIGGRFSRKYALWKERLLDLTAGNRLLNFRPTKVATIGITAPKIEALHESLVVREQPLRFPLYRGRVQLAPVGRDEERAQNQQSETRYSVVPGDLEVAGKTPPELEKGLYRLAALARSSKDERGINTLYLALGMLVWRPAEGNVPGSV